MTLDCQCALCLSTQIRPEIERNLQELLDAEHIVLPTSYDNLNELGVRITMKIDITITSYCVQ